MQSLRLASALHAAQIATTSPFHVLLTVYSPSDTDAVLLRLHYGPDDLTYDGQTYIAFAFQFPTIPQKANGELPQIQLAVCNVNRLVQQYLETYGGGVGAKVEIRVVSDLDLTGPPLEYLEFTITSVHADSMWATFTLGADNPMRAPYPRFIYMQDYCRVTFNAPSLRAAGNPGGVGLLCGYTGQATTCDHRLATCRALGNSKRFGGFPMIDKAGFRGASIV